MLAGQNMSSPTGSCLVLVPHVRSVYRTFARSISPHVLSGLTELLFQPHFFVGKKKLLVSNINA